MLHNPPFYRYSLFKEWDKEVFNFIKIIARDKNYPKLIGNSNNKNQFLTTLIRTQKSIHDWRLMLIDIIDQIKNTSIIDALQLNQKYPPESIGKDIPIWVTYEEDRIVNAFIDELASKKVEFIGTVEETGEFILRFILGQLGLDWEQTIIMIWEVLGNDDALYLKALNKEMKNFDYHKLFK